MRFFNPQGEVIGEIIDGEFISDHKVYREIFLAITQRVFPPRSSGELFSLSDIGEFMAHNMYPEGYEDRSEEGILV